MYVFEICIDLFDQRASLNCRFLLRAFPGDSTMCLIEGTQNKWSIMVIYSIGGPTMQILDS